MKKVVSYNIFYIFYIICIPLELFYKYYYYIAYLFYHSGGKIMDTIKKEYLNSVHYEGFIFNYYLKGAISNKAVPTIIANTSIIASIPMPNIAG